MNEWTLKREGRGMVKLRENRGRKERECRLAINLAAGWLVEANWREGGLWCGQGDGGRELRTIEGSYFPTLLFFHLKSIDTAEQLYF